MKRAVLFYPLLVAAVPILFLAAQNPVEAEAVQVLSALGAVLMATALLTLLAWIVLRDDAKAAATVSILLVTFFSFGHIVDTLKAATVFGIYLGRLRYLYLFYLVGSVTAIAVLLGVLRYKQSLLRPMHYFGSGVLLLVALNLLSLGFSNAGGSGTQDTSPNVRGDAKVLIRSGSELPDIYYVILDGYARADVLETVHSFDNSEFIDFLRSMGFYVASQSRSNYIHSNMSLASSLNMRYLSDDDSRFLRLFESNEVSRIAKTVGYKLVHFDSGWRFTRRNPEADIQFSASDVTGGGLKSALLNDFSEGLMRTTLARQFNVQRFFSLQGAEIFHYNLERLMDIADDPDPTFAFLHIQQPHPPYIFDRTGRLLSKSKDNPQTKYDWALTDLYVGQLQYVNEVVQQAVEHILSRSTAEPIIIIQGDHGTAATKENPVLDQNLTDLFIFERTGILNAYHLPERCASGLYPTITPVNSFRLLFNRCFGSDFEFLADKTLFSKNSYSPYHFFSVPDVSP